MVGKWSSKLNYIHSAIFPGRVETVLKASRTFASRKFFDVTSRVMGDTRDV